jgi:hypothetical protein
MTEINVKIMAPKIIELNAALVTDFPSLGLRSATRRNTGSGNL